MGIKFQSPLELSAHRAIAHSDSAQVLIVKVVTKTAAHPEYGNGSSNGYTIDGIEGAYIELTPGNTYKFDQSDSSNNGHPLRFYEEADKTTAYTTGVTTNGTPGTSGAYTQIIPTTSTPPILFYQCSAHALMGSYVKFGTGSQGDTYTLSATQDGNNVDILLDAGSGTDSTVQLTAGNNITLTRNDAQQITIASSGGGAGTVTVEKNTYTGDGSDTTFNTSTAIVNENNVQVYLDGVYQSKDNYSTSNNVITFSTAPPSGTAIELIHMVAVDAVIARDAFTGNGSTTAYALSTAISNENATQVYIDGVYQSKNNYSTSGSTITFTTAPPNGAALEVVHIKANSNSTIDWESSVKTSSFTAAAGEGYFINTTGGAITVTLPSTPTIGDVIELIDFAGTSSSNKILITSSNNIEGASGDKAIRNNFGSVRIVYSGSTKGWLSSSADALQSPTPDLVVDYLVVGGGGAGGYLGGGGGAGGLRTSYGSTSGGGAAAESSLSLSLNTNYTVTVGTGGTKVDTYHVNGTNGTNSVFHTITSLGGGGGGNHSNGVGAVGGSGGGGSSSGSSNAGGAGTINQGFAGGANGASASNYGSGGGGGAGAVGAQGSGSAGGNGGAGLAVGITGSNVTYAGGGGGGSQGGTAGTGGAGGGGNATNNNTTGAAGAANTGGGGGGGGYSAPNFGSGGSGGTGVVILRYPQEYFIHIPSGMNQTTTTSGSDKITTFTSGNGNITFQLTAQPSTDFDYLVVAGGGGGGGVGGGGGAGGYRTSYGDSSVSALSLIAGTYNVAVGGGGAQSASGAAWNGDGGIGANGTDSTFHTITSTGGGGGAGSSNGPGDGGSGGGARSADGGIGNTPATVPSQGNDGGNAGSTYIGGGGGGAAQAGNTSANHGGDGKQNSITGTATYYAGGGGGGGNTGGSAPYYIGNGGQGGGGNGGANNGTPNTGGGGGGGTWTNNANTTTQRGGAGGSGVVILRYANTTTLTISSGLVSTTATSGSDKITTFTSGTGTITFS